MKGGKVPVHIQRWAPADFQEDEDVKLLLKRKDFAVYAFYRQFLDCSFMAGGDLSSNVERLSAVLGLSEKVVEAGLEFCLGRLIHQEGDRLYQSRVRAEVADELAFRETQAEHGKRRWSKGSHRLASSKPNGDKEGSLSPPAPSASALRQAPTPSPKEKEASPPPAERKLTPQQERVRNIEVVYSAFPGSDPPDPSLIAKWLSTWEGDDGDLIRALSTMGEEGTLSMPPAYVTKCLATAKKNGGKAPRPSKPKRFTPAQAGLTEKHLASYRARGGGGE